GAAGLLGLAQRPGLTAKSRKLATFVCRTAAREALAAPLSILKPPKFFMLLMFLRSSAILVRLDPFALPERRRTSLILPTPEEVLGGGLEMDLSSSGPPPPGIPSRILTFSPVAGATGCPRCVPWSRRSRRPTACHPGSRPRSGRSPHGRAAR